MTKKERTIIAILGIIVVCVFGLLALLILNSFVVPSQTATTTKSQELVTVLPSQTTTTTKSEELIKAEQLLPVNTPHRDIVLDEVRQGHLPALDIEIYQYMQDRWTYYEKLDGKYISSRHDPLVSRDAQTRYNLSKEEIDRRYYSVAKLLAGIRPQEPTKLDVTAIPVVITIDRVELSAKKELLVTATNSTNLDRALPTINMTFNLYSGGVKVSSQVVWAEKFWKGTSVFRSFPISANFDSVECIAYMNVDEMKSYNLKSTVQASNDRGESVIPIYIMPRTRIK